MANSPFPPDVVVVGAGAGGILAAWRAAQSGAKVLLLEKTPRIGTKILISGGGKCNVAHAGPLEDVIRAFRPEEARFIRPACYRLTNQRIMELVTSKGIELYARPDGRVFPVTATAKEIVAALVDYLTEEQVRICLNTPVVGLDVRDGRVAGVRVEVRKPQLGKEIPTGGFGAKALLGEALQTRAAFGSWDGPDRIICPRVVLATGGSSYPASGTTGDGWSWLRALGHTVVPIRPALAPIYLIDPRAEWSGVALRDCRLKARVQGREVAKAEGDLLFTHQGITGPVTLRISRVVAEQSGPVQMEVDLLPGSSFEDVSARILSQVQDNPRRSIGSVVEEMMPERLVEPFLSGCGIDRDLPGPQLAKKLRNRLATALKGWPIGQVRVVPLEKGEVVAGGVSLDEVDPQTMRSKLVEGLFLCGEILDVAGPVGGYNLQAAFATGFVAGESAGNPLPLGGEGRVRAPMRPGGTPRFPKP